MQQEEVTSQIIGAAIEVHRVLGPGFLETVYEQALAVELKAVKELAPEHFAVVRSYLRACNRDLGLLLNFAKVKLDIKCVYARAPDS